MIAVNLTESQVAAISGASDEIVVRAPNGETIGYLRLIPDDEGPLRELTLDEILLIKKRMADPIEMTITTEELVRRLDAGNTR
jgi:hypothetical protein